MMKVLQNFKSIEYSIDLFCSSQLLRYNQDTQYKTLTGGLLSMGIIAVIITGFASMITDTFNKTSITSDFTIIKQEIPSPLTLTAGKQNNFMFGIQINSWDLSYRVNLSVIPRYFSVVMQQFQYQYGQVLKSSFISLEQCTRQHWSMFPELFQNFDNPGVEGSSWLCLPVGSNISLRGSFSNTNHTFAQIYVSICQNQTVSGGICAPQQEIDNLFNIFGNFDINFCYSNPVINPNQPDQIFYYLETGDYVIISKTIGSQTWIQFSDITINTDYSILPFTNIHTQKGAIIESKSINHPFTSFDSLLATLIFQKSANSLIYNRQVQKISAVFSYIGGLVGAVTAFLFMVKSYTDTSLQVTIGLSLFQQMKQQKQSFNLFDYLRLGFYRFLRMCKWKGQWEFPQKLQSIQSEAVKQMDVCKLLQRLLMLEKSMSYFLSNDDLQKIKEKYKQKISLKTAKNMRNLFIKKQNQKSTIEIEEYSSQNSNKIHNENLGVPNFQQPYVVSLKKRQLSNKKSLGWRDDDKLKIKENEDFPSENQKNVQISSAFSILKRYQNIINSSQIRDGEDKQKIIKSQFSNKINTKLDNQIRKNIRKMRSQNFNKVNFRKQAQQ